MTEGNNNLMEFKKTIDAVHKVLIDNNIKDSCTLNSPMLPFKMIHEIYQIFPVNNSAPQFIHKDFDNIPQQILYRGNPKNRLNQWLLDIKHPEFVFHLKKAQNVDNLGDRLRFGHGYYFTDSIEYVLTYLVKSHHHCVINEDKMDFIIEGKIDSRAKLLNFSNIAKELNEVLPPLNYKENITISHHNTPTEKLLLMSCLCRHEYHQTLASLFLGYDGLKIDRTTSSKSENPIHRTEYVITNRKMLIIRERNKSIVQATK